MPYWGHTYIKRLFVVYLATLVSRMHCIVHLLTAGQRVWVEESRGVWVMAMFHSPLGVPLWVVSSSAK